MTGRVIVRVDESRCAGSGTCALIAPRWFSVDAGGLSVAPADPLHGDEPLVEAIESCPTEALTAFDAETGEQIHPSW